MVGLQIYLGITLAFGLLAMIISGALWGDLVNDPPTPEVLAERQLLGRVFIAGIFAPLITPFLLLWVLYGLGKAIIRICRDALPTPKRVIKSPELQAAEAEVERLLTETARRDK